MVLRYSLVLGELGAEDGYEPDGVEMSGIPKDDVLTLFGAQSYWRVVRF